MLILTVSNLGQSEGKATSAFHDEDETAARGRFARAVFSICDRNLPAEHPTFAPLGQMDLVKLVDWCAETTLPATFDAGQWQVWLGPSQAA
jgi:hypothetical protein